MSKPSPPTRVYSGHMQAPARALIMQSTPAAEHPVRSFLPLSRDWVPSRGDPFENVCFGILTIITAHVTVLADNVSKVYEGIGDFIGNRCLV